MEADRVWCSCMPARQDVNELISFFVMAALQLAAALVASNLGGMAVDKLGENSVVAKT